VFIHGMPVENWNKLKVRGMGRIIGVIKVR
jgi:hypothetical protein